MENFNQKNNFTTDIDEAGGGVRGTVVTKLVGDAKSFKALSKEAKLVFADMESAIKLNQNPIMLGNKPLKTGEEIFMAIKDGSLLKSPKELARVEKGFLKSANTEANMRQVIATSFAADANVLKELANSNKSTVKDIKKYISDKGYPKSSVDEIVKQMQINGAIKDGKLVKDASSVVKTGGSTAKSGKSIWSRAKELVTNIKVKKMTWKQLLAWGTGISLGGAALWYYIKQYSDVLPKDMPNTPPQDWGNCLNDMIKNNTASVKHHNSLNVDVVISKPDSNFPGGLQFFHTGRVLNLKTRDKGDWKCVGGQTQTNENMNKPKLNESIGQIVKRVLNERYLMEQSEDEMANDVDKMVNYLDVPVWGDDYSKIYEMLLKYKSNGKFKDFSELYKETGFNKSDTLRGDIEAIYAIDAKPVLWKRKILALLSQIETGRSVSSSTNNTNTNTGGGSGTQIVVLKEDRLEIKFDKDKIPGGGGNTGGGGTGGGGTGGGGTTRKTYYDCSGVNIETTPLTYGCKDTKIGQIQACLGITSDNKFGPTTRKTLIGKGHDVTNGITKAIYDKVIADCKQGSVAQTTTSTEGGADVKYLRTPITMKSVDLPKIPSANTSTSGAPSSEGMTDTQYYTSLIDAGLFNATGIIGRTAYNGPALEPSEKQKLDRVLDSMQYDPSNVTATDKGARYVWQKR
jgi:hypothetical protein